MRKSITALLVLLVCCTPLVRATEDYTYLKIAVDGMAVNNALFALSSSSKNEKALLYHTKIDQLLDELASHNTGFRKDMYPAELKVKSENEAHIKMICAKLTKTLKEVREYAAAAEHQFDLNDLPLIMTLKSENPGDYYIGINPDFIFTLANHPFRKSIEELQLQDIGFVEVLASSDTSLWNLSYHCPNLKIITLFAANINDEILVKLKLDRVQNLKSLELSENSISSIPSNFNASNSLIYLSLRRNKLRELPKDLSNWSNLKYLHIGGNQLDGAERLRIQKALPSTQIIF